MKSKPYLINPDKTGQALVRIQPEKQRFTESWLQELLDHHPHILPVDEIEPVFWPLVSIGREIQTTAGSIDNLFISKAGYPVLVETKLWRNSEARREVLAQAIDYASALSTWTFEQLNEASEKKNKKGIIDLIQTAFDADTDELPSEETISKNLRLGRFLVLVVSDYIRSSLIDMLNYVNRYPHLATNVGLVELQCYTLPDHSDQLLVVPSIIARTEIVERSIVQVNIQPQVAHTISVDQIKADKDEKKARQALTEDAYWEGLQQSSMEYVKPAKQIFDHFGKYPEIVLKMRQSAIVARMNLPDSDQRISLFFINTSGILECWYKDVCNQLENAGLDRALGEEYRAQLSSLLKHKRGILSIYTQVDQVDVNAFIQIVDQFIEKVLNAEPFVKE